MGSSTRTIRRRRRNRSRASNVSIQPRSSASFQELTVPGNYVFGGINLQELINVEVIPYRDIMTMIDMDGHARALFEMMRRPILRNTKRAFIKPYKSGEGEAEAEFIHNNLLERRHAGGTELSFSSTIAQMCMAFVTGFQAFEKKWDRPGTVLDDGYIRLGKLSPRNSSTIKIRVDDRGMFDGIHQETGWRGQTIDVNVPRERSCVYAINTEENPHYGKSVFLPSYYHFDKKHKLYYIVHLALALGSLPPVIAKAKPSVAANDRGAFLREFSSRGTNSVFLLPSGIDIEKDDQISPPTTGLPYMEIIEHHNREMSKSVLGQFLDVGTSEGGGGFSLSKNHMDFLVMSLEDRMNEMAEIYNNHVIPELISWNFGTTNYPTLQFPPFTDEIRDLLFTLAANITAAREVPFSAEFVAEIEKDMSKTLGFDMEESIIDQNAARRVAQEEQEAAMEQQLARAQLEAAKNPPPTNGGGGNNQSRNNANSYLDDPEFIKFAENLSVKIRDRISKEAFLNN